MVIFLFYLSDSEEGIAMLLKIAKVIFYPVIAVAGVSSKIHQARGPIYEEVQEVIPPDDLVPVWIDSRRAFAEGNGVNVRQIHVGYKRTFMQGLKQLRS